KNEAIGSPRPGWAGSSAGSDSGDRKGCSAHAPAGGLPIAFHAHHDVEELIIGTAIDSGIASGGIERVRRRACDACRIDARGADRSRRLGEDDADIATEVETR